MLIIGLTGSIATGKSTVSSILANPPYSLPIIDADIIARKVVEPGKPAYKAIVNYFGPSTPDLLLPGPLQTSSQETQSQTSSQTETQSQPQKQKQQNHETPLNRPALGRRVFGNTPDRIRDRRMLNKIVHPAVRWEITKALLHHYLRGTWGAVLDVPLLFESGMDMICGTVMVVGVSDARVQMERLRGRDAHLTEEDAANRVKSQGDVRGKVAKVEWRGVRGRGRGVVVWNDGGKEELRGEVERVMGVVRRGSPRWWGWLLLVLPPLAVGVAVWGLVVNFWLRRTWERKEKEEEKRGKAKL